MSGCFNSYSKLVINVNNLQYNLKKIRKYVGRDLILVVKNDAYGHGAIGISRYASEIGIKKFAVISLSEARKLRENGINGRIILMGKLFKDEFEEIVRLELEPTVFELEETRKIEEACKKLDKNVKVHLNVETGMNRLGISAEDAKKILDYVEKSSHLEIGGVYSHFSTPLDKEYSSYQIEKFENFVNSLDKKYYLHFSNSVPSLLYPNSRYDGVRIGILSYGIEFPGIKDIKLKKVATLTSKVIKIIKAKKGESVGYSRKFTAEKDARIAVLQIGYGDGLPYNFNNGGKVWIKGKLHRVVGSVCMDHIFVEVDDNVINGDDAEIFGEKVPIEKMAKVCKTIPYDISVKISPEIPRIYTKNKEVLLKVKDSRIC